MLIFVSGLCQLQTTSSQRKATGKKAEGMMGFKGFVSPVLGCMPIKGFSFPIATKPPVTIGDNHYSRGKDIILPPVPLLPKGH